MSMFQSIINEFNEDIDLNSLSKNNIIFSMEDYHQCSAQNANQDNFPYTPIKIQKTDNELIIQCHITGFIDTIDNYVDLISILEYGVDEFSKVYIYINSTGGYLNTGAMVASAIENSRASVTTINTGMAGSAAALIWSAGHKCEFSEFSTFLFHMSSHSACGQPSTQIRQEADLLIDYVQQILLVAKNKGHITLKEYEEIAINGADIFVTAEQMALRINQEQDDIISFDGEESKLIIKIGDDEIDESDQISNDGKERLPSSDEGPILNDDSEDLFDIQEGDK